MRTAVTTLQLLLELVSDEQVSTKPYTLKRAISSAAGPVSWPVQLGLAVASPENAGKHPRYASFIACTPARRVAFRSSEWHCAEPVPP